MGYMRHHTIVVTSWDEQKIAAAHRQAKRIFEWVSPISPVVVNGYRSFFIPPDGSKEGWDTSNKGDERRDRFIEKLNKYRYNDGSTAVQFVEVIFGEEAGNPPHVTRGV